MELTAIILSAAALLGVLVLFRRLAVTEKNYEQRVHSLSQTIQDLNVDARFESLQGTDEKVSETIEKILDRVREVERDRTRLFEAAQSDRETIARVEEILARTERSIGQLVDRVRTVEKDRTDLLREMRALATSRNRGDMPVGPEPELELSDALANIQIPAGNDS